MSAFIPWAVLLGVVVAPRAAGENEVISNDEIQEEEHADDEARKR